MLSHLSGYDGSRPVRIGNAADKQFQLDIYGEVADAATRFAEAGGEHAREARRVLVEIGRQVCKCWREPDNGIWETRAGRTQHTYSKVLCWVALDRLVRLHERGHLRAPVDEFRRVRDEIRTAIETRGYNEQLQSYRRRSMETCSTRAS